MVFVKDEAAVGAHGYAHPYRVPSPTGPDTGLHICVGSALPVLKYRALRRPQVVERAVSIGSTLFIYARFERSPRIPNIIIMRSLFLSLSIIAALLCFDDSAAKKITINVIPETAKIYIDGQIVGEGSYQVKFDKNSDFYV